MLARHQPVDNRLLHRRVASSSNAEFKTECITVVVGKVADDSLCFTLSIAVAPASAPVPVLSIKRCVTYCSIPEGAGVACPAL